MITQTKKIWEEAEDQALRKIYEEQTDPSWSVIAKRLSSEYNFPRKSAKQCRQRYENHIAADGYRMEWTRKEEEKMIELHNELGNKWALIAQNIPGKNDNAIKNHFYSKLRRILRKLNTVIQAHLKREFRTINIGTLYKIVEATEERFKEDPSCGFEVSSECRQVQNKMLHVSMLKEEEFDSAERLSIYTDLVKSIYRASKLYKRKSKKIRNSSIQAPNTKKKRMREAKQRKKNQEEGYDSDSSSVFEDGIFSESEKKPESEAPQIPDIVVTEHQQGIKDMLKDAGILKVDQDDGSKSAFNFSARSSFKSYSDRNDSNNQFFEDSENERGMSKHRSHFNKFRGRLLDDPSGGSERQFQQNFL